MNFTGFHIFSGGSQNYVDDVSKELGSLTIKNAQHNHQANSPSGGDYARRHSSE